MSSDIERLTSENEQLKSQVESLRGLVAMNYQAIEAYQAQIDFRDKLLQTYVDAISEANREARLAQEKMHSRRR